MDPEGSLFDDHVRPRPGDQLFFRDRLAGALGQGSQNIEGATTEAHRFPFLGQHEPRGDQPERSEDEDFFIHLQSLPEGAALGTNRGGRSRAHRYHPRAVSHARRHPQADAKMLLHNFIIVNATDAADRVKLPTTDQTEGTAVTTNSDVEVAPDHLTMARRSPSQSRRHRASRHRNGGSRVGRIELVGADLLAAVDACLSDGR